jgi:hypothetical protein
MISVTSRLSSSEAFKVRGTDGAVEVMAGTASLICVSAPRRSGDLLRRAVSACMYVYMYVYDGAVEVMAGIVSLMYVSPARRSGDLLRRAVSACMYVCVCVCVCVQLHAGLGTCCGVLCLRVWMFVCMCAYTC